MALVAFLRGTESAILALGTNKTAQDGKIYVATDTGRNWMGKSDGTLLLLDHNDNTEYGLATTTLAGLMSADEHNKLAAITDSADAVSVTQTLKSGTEVGKVTVNGTATTLYAPTNTNTTYTLTQDSSDGHKLTFTPSSGTATTITIPDNNTKYSAGSGLSLSGTTFNHASTVTASTAGTSSATSGATLAVPYVTYNATGHITSTGTHTHTIGSLAASAVTSGTFDAARIPTIQTAKIADNAVTDAKIASVSADKITGTIASSHLPSYVDDVIEGYYGTSGSTTGFFSTKASDGTLSGAITGETGKIYVDLTTNKTYRWSGSAYVVISETLAIGTTASTAFAGDKGQTAYEHVSKTNNPHGVTKSQVGLGSVANLDQSKAIKSITRSGTTYTATALDGSTTTFTQQDNNDNTTYTISNSGSTITLTPSSGTAQSITVPNTEYSDATTSTHGLMSTSDKSKLNGIASGAEVNQNAFSNVTVGSTTIAADAKTDTITLVAAGGITLTPDATNDKLTISSTTYTSLKNPYSLTIQGNGTTLKAYDGSSAQTVNLTYSNVGADQAGAASSALSSAKSYTDTALTWQEVS